MRRKSREDSAERVIRESYKTSLESLGAEIENARFELRREQAAQGKADTLDGISAIHCSAHDRAVAVALERVGVRRTDDPGLLIARTDAVLLGDDFDRAERIEGDCRDALADQVGIERDDLRVACLIHDGQRLFSQMLDELQGHCQRLRDKEVSPEALRGRGGGDYRRLLASFEQETPVGTPTRRWYAPLREMIVREIAEFEREVGAP